MTSFQIEGTRHICARYVASVATTHCAFGAAYWLVLANGDSVKVSRTTYLRAAAYLNNQDAFEAAL